MRFWNMKETHKQTLQPIPSRTSTSASSRLTSPPPSSPVTPRLTSRSSPSPSLPNPPRRPTSPMSCNPTRARTLRLRARPPAVRPPLLRSTGSLRRKRRRLLLPTKLCGLGKNEKGSGWMDDESPLGPGRTSVN